MYKISNISISGFWGLHQVKTKIDSFTNIFIGKNGSGKTTFINIIQSVLTVELLSLSNLQFDSVVINLSDGSHKRKITVTKTLDDIGYSSIEYQIGTSKYRIPYNLIREIKLYGNRIRGLSQRYYREVEEIKKQINKLVNVSYLSVYRDEIKKSDNAIQNRDENHNSINTRLNKLMSELTAYQLQLENDLLIESKSFQENVLRTMLYNEEFDHIDISKKKSIDIDSARQGLRQAYKGLGILDTKTAEVIEKHVKAIEKATRGINNHVTLKVGLSVQDITPITLLNRTRRIIELSDSLEETKKRIMRPLNQFIEILNSFHDSKIFEFPRDKNRTIVIKKEDNDIQVSELSSGEKQLMILLTESLLQKNSQTLYIADEPELSLHIEWQRKLLPSIKQINPNSQIIIATHSPEIVGKLKEYTINMEGIIDG